MAWVTKRGKSWSVRYRTVDDAGNATNKRVSGFASESDAWAAAKQLERDTNAGLDVHGGLQTAGYWIERWFNESCIGRIEETTLAKYDNGISILQSHPIYNQQVKKLNKQTLRQLVEDLRTRDGKERSVRTALDYTEPLRFALSWAEGEGYIAHNPIAGSRLPKTEEPRKVFLSDEDMRILAEEAGRTRESPKKKTITGGNFYIPILLALYGGLRREEVGGLRWDQVDFKRNTITIMESHALTMDRRRVVKMPKSKMSKRTLSMPNFVMEALKNAPKYGEYVSMKKNGELYALDSYAQAVSRLIKKINKDREGSKMAPIPSASFHDLRHTHAAYLIRLDLHPKVISERLGHKSIKITMDLYGYLMTGLQGAAADAINADVASATKKAKKQTGAKVGAKVGADTPEIAP